MSGKILKIGKNISKTAGKITLNSTSGDITLSSKKGVNVSSKEEVIYDSYQEIEQEEQEDLLANLLEGPEKIVPGKELTFTTCKFSRRATPAELKEVKWAYQLDDEPMVCFEKPGRVIGGSVSKRIRFGEDLKEHKKIKVFAYFKNPEGEASLELDILSLEKIFVVGTEQYSQTYGNKLMFPAQAIREVKNNVDNKSHHITILIFKEGFTAEELKLFEENGKSFVDRLRFIQINTVDEMIKYLNKGDDEISRDFVQIDEVKVFSHGFPSRITFGLGEFSILEMSNENDLSKEFNKSHVAELDQKVFSENATFYSYACRTGNNSNEKEFSKEGYEVVYYPINPRTRLTSTKWFSDKESAQKFYDGKNDGFIQKALELRKVPPPIQIADITNSLAQRLANHLDILVYAYVVRSDYSGTWNDGGDTSYREKYMILEDESVDISWSPSTWDDKDEALWNPTGAYNGVKSGNTPKGLDQGLFLFRKNRNPEKTDL